MGNINLDNYEAYLLDHLEGNLGKAETEELRSFVVLHPELNIDLDSNDLPYFSKDEEAMDFREELLKTEENFPAELLINYVEGNLSAEEKQRFEESLLSDNELRLEVELFKKTISFADESETFAEKNLLLKTEDELLLNSGSLLFVEGLLSETEKQAFENRILSDKVLSLELELYKKTKLFADAAVVYPGKEDLKKKPRIVALFSTRNVIALAAAILLIIGLAIVFNSNNSEKGTKIEIAKNVEKKENVQPKEKVNQMELKKNTNDVDPVKQNLAAKKSVRIKREENKIDSLPLNNIPGNNIAKEEKQKVENIIPEVNEKRDSAIVAVYPKNILKKEEVNETKKLVLLAVEEEDESPAQEQKGGNRFWRRAVKVAQQVNGLGVKAVNGDEKQNENYMLSFNAFSIEKK